MDGSPEMTSLLALHALQARIQHTIGGTLSVHGLGYSEFLVLRALHDAPEYQLRRVDLARRVHLTASGVTRLLNPMEKLGMVRKAEAARDARVRLVALTDSGRRLLEHAAASVQEAADQLFAPLDPTERLTLTELILRLG